jgi:hypothetical protein
LTLGVSRINVEPKVQGLEAIQHLYAFPCDCGVYYSLSRSDLEHFDIPIKDTILVNAAHVRASRDQQAHDISMVFPNRKGQR